MEARVFENFSSCMLLVSVSTNRDNKLEILLKVHDILHILEFFLQFT